ncbi:MarR family winged helix-turn-helix transcriptional regulator [Streptomyces sp. NBC_00572]|uniref:MarR family winged helix-turn-helix transcriptional regulator n=1 Tax=Streptomyces sp. NBC_00572 TaxID=2903664 RepID=UPI0022533316|nr:MarR family transcriptional regulator [Streptomyces sp. NBC_00572]MCX4986161.1 MarR family transcriptional regulator [Streptomyces sp. NBC_00572]
MSGDEHEDAVDRIAADWQRERPDLDVTPLAFVGRIALVAETLIGPAGERAVEQHGINKGDFDVLATLRRRGAPYSVIPSVLSAELMMSRAGMTKRLDRLEGAGLVRRTLDADDRRSFRVTLTEEGLAIVDAALTDLVECLGGLVAGLGQDERHHLDNALRTLLRSHQR